MITRLFIVVNVIEHKQSGTFCEDPIPSKLMQFAGPASYVFGLLLV